MAPTLAQAACQQTADFTGKALNGTVTLDVSSCSDGIRAGLYDGNGFDTNTTYPIPVTQPPAFRVGGPDQFGRPKTFTVSGGATFLMTPVTADGGTTWGSYTIQITQLGTSSTASLPLFYASTSNINNLFYGFTDTSYSISVTNAPSTTPAPTVTSLNPTSGSTAGGNSVVITGTNFTGTTGAAGVKFGSTNATSCTVNSNTQITATAPAGAPGAIDVTVTNNSQTSAISANSKYSYGQIPTITSITPNSGSPAGGTSVTIAGSNFSASSNTVTFGGAGGSITAQSAAHRPPCSRPSVRRRTA